VATPSTYIPLRAQPNVPDENDGRRLQLVSGRWTPQDMLLAQRDKQIEENVRMLAGRQWEVFSPTLGRFVDVSMFMRDAERAFRQRPVINRLLLWFILTHARLTESPPVVSFQPSTADRADATLAEVMDPIFKTLWNEAGMLEVVDRLVAWLIPCGEVYWSSRVDFTRGAIQTFPQTAYDNNGVLQVVGQRAEREGALAVDVHSPLEVRGEWNQQPWHEKAWHIRRSFLTPKVVKERWGLDVKADATGLDATMGGAYLTRLLFGSGHYGAVKGNEGEITGVGAHISRPEDGLVIVDEMWERPCIGTDTEETAESAGGRFLVVLPLQNKVVWDSVRPYRLKAASPIRHASFVNLPGRPSGTSPQEMMNPVQRAYNRGWAQILEHRALMTNPVVELDANSGLQAADFVARPGAVIPVQKRPGVEAFRYVSPPQISSDVWRTQDQLSDTLDVLGNVPGAQGSPPTVDASGELVKELRFNSDRFIGPTSRRLVIELARTVDDWIAMLPVMWTTERILSYAGDDNIPRTLTVLPHFFEGKVNVIPDIESMLPEGRGERQQKVLQLYQLGAFGVPGAPDAVKKFLELSRFPHLSRTIRAGGVHRVTADHFLGRLLQGENAQELPLFEWYNYDVHLAVLDEFMASPDFLTQPPPVQEQLVIRRMLVVQAQQALMLQNAQKMALQATLQGQVAVAGQAPAMAAAAAMNPQPESATEPA
jgi:hypothetical protein